MANLVDYSAGYPGAASVKAAGYDGAIRYLCNSPDRGLIKKKTTLVETRDFRDHGLELVSNWQKGKGTTADFKVGDPFQTGVQMGKQALASHFEVGGPGYCPIYFSVDEDVDLNTWNSRVLPWLNGIASVIGKEWVGVYGGQRSMWWADDDGFKWRWQTLGWSRYDQNGNWNSNLPVQWVEGVNIRQFEIDKGKINGIGIDRNSTHTTDYGQWSINRNNSKPETTTKPEESVVTVAAPKYVDISKLGNSSSNRWGARITNFYLHTQEGNGTAESLAGYLNNSANGASYHYTVRDGIVCSVVDTDKASWSVLDANASSINLCFAGSRASWSRADWLKLENDIRIAAWLAIKDSRKYKFASNVIAPPYKRGEGFSDHKYVTQCLGIGNHTDVGPNFPWDKFNQFVREYLNGAAVKPVVNMINEEANVAKAWIGERLDKDEQKCKDGVGRFVRFTGGVIYWHPITGAYAIPGRLFETYTRLGWEQGFLGYPIGRHTVLREGNKPDGKIVGGVQGFEYGAIYRKEGDDIGHAVGGDIRNQWNRAGFENGQYGWPTGDEIEIVPGVRIQDFENGRLLWAPGKVIGLKPTDGIDEVYPIF